MANRKGWRKSKRIWLVLLPALTVFAWFFVDAAAYAAFLRVYFIPTGSMSPTLAAGDRIAVDSRPGLRPRRGEVWVFSVPNGGIWVKRIVGLPGETVEVSGGRVLVNGTPLAEPYLAAPTPYAMPPTRVGPDQYFVLGDNRKAAQDSHSLGPLHASRLLGRVQYRYWPPARFGALR
jgi:signal peptidase I